MPPGIGYPNAMPGTAATAGNSTVNANIGNPPAGGQNGQGQRPQKPTGQVAQGLANLTEQEALMLDRLLEANPEITGLLMKAFPKQAVEIKMFLKMVDSSGGQAPQAPQGITPAGPTGGSDLNPVNPLAQISLR